MVAGGDSVQPASQQPSPLLANCWEYLPGSNLIEGMLISTCFYVKIVNYPVTNLEKPPTLTGFRYHNRYPKDLQAKSTEIIFY